MNLFGKDLDSETVFVAEIGVNHEGDIAAAKRMISLAKEAGAHAAKLQSYTPARYATASDPERLKRVTRFSLTEAQHRQLADHARLTELPLFSTPLTEDWVPLLSELFPVIKIASGDITFRPVLSAAARTGKPIILSTGGSTFDEINQAIAWLRDEIGEEALTDRIMILQCTSSYPCPVDEVNLASIPFLAEKTGLRVGFSNHMIGLEACFAAIALGACLIEAHFTDSRSGRSFRDHELSLEPAEFARLVSEAPKWRSMRGRVGKIVQPSEVSVRPAIRKGVIASHALKPGDVLSLQNLAYARPATEFAASELPALIGRRLKVPVGSGELIRKADLE